MSWNRLDSTEGSLSILLLTCIPCSGLLQFQHSISNTQKTYADSGHKLQPPCWEKKKKPHTPTHSHSDEGFVQCVHLRIDLCHSKLISAFVERKEVAAYILKEKSASCLQERPREAHNESLISQRTMA